MRFIIRILINALALWVTTLILPGIYIESSIWAFLLVAVIFGLVNALVRPVVSLLALPITCLTLGLFTLVINALMILLTSWLAGGVMAIAGSRFEQFLTALLGGIVISIVSALLSWILPDERS